MDISTTSSPPSAATGNQKIGSDNRQITQGQGPPPAMVPLKQDRPSEMMQRPPSSASSASGMSYQTATSNGTHQPSQHKHALGPGNNHHMGPQYRNGPTNYHHPSHGQSHQGMFHGEPMMGAIRGQGRPHIPDHHNMQNSNCHQSGFNHHSRRYPSQHMVRNGDGFGHANGFGRPGPARNFHHQTHQPHYHSFAPVRGPQGMGQQNGSRGPSPSFQHQPTFHQHNPKSQGDAAIAQPQDSQQLAPDANSSIPSGANTSQGAPPGGRNQPPLQNGPGQSSFARQAMMHGQNRHAMHQGYTGHQYNNQYPERDQAHLGNQAPMHQGGHPNNMQPEMQHYNYHHPSHGGNGSGNPFARSQYRGHQDNGAPGGYSHGPGGHREMYSQGHNQNYHQQQLQNHRHQPHSYAQPVPPPPQQGPSHGFQLPKYNSSRTPKDPEASSTNAHLGQSMSRSPSPPPSPPPAPSAQALLRAKLREQSAKKPQDEVGSIGSGTSGTIMTTTQEIHGSQGAYDENQSRRSSSGSNSSTTGAKPTALGDRGNVTVVTAGTSTTKTPVSETVLKPAKQEDITADAASILLQLGSVMNRSVGGSENQNPTNQASPPIPSSVQHSASMDDVSEAGTMLTMQTDIPDLTSDPSSDSIDSVVKHVPSTKQEPDSDFPCDVPDRYPTRLALPFDNAKLNNLHCFLRSELLEIFVVSKSKKKSPCHSPSSSVGRVGLRCVHCAMSRMSCADAPMSVFYPKSIAEIYRLVTSWQRCHLRKCKKIPPVVRAKWEQLRNNDKSRGKTHYWVTSAKQIGLMDCTSRAGGIRFAPDFDASDLPPNTPLSQSAKEAAEKAAAIAAKAQKIVSMATAAAVSTMPVVPENMEMTDAPNLNCPTAVNSTAIRT